MPHFLISSNTVNKDQISIIDKELYNHIVKALRIKKDEKLLLIDENEIQYIVNVEDISKSEIHTKVIEKYKSNRKLYHNINLAQSVLKPDAQFSTIQKATELGIKTIIPLITDNCTVKQSIINEKISKWQKIAIESVKQCERADIPQIKSSTTLTKLLNSKEYDIVVAFVEKYSTSSLKNFLKSKIDLSKKSILAIIGPEGGFSEKEFGELKEHNIPMVSLGNLIYRADTAATVAIANIIYGLDNE